MPVGPASTRVGASLRRTRLLTILLLAGLLLAAPFAGCTLPRQGSLERQCTADVQCDDQNPCTVNTCTPEGRCDRQAVEPDGPIAQQTAGDCAIARCQGGQLVNTFAESDVYDDGEACTEDLCSEQEGPLNRVLDDGTPCLRNGDPGTCRTGSCEVVCTTDAECSDDGDRCTDEYCNSAGLCDATAVPDGTPLDSSEQVEGDCVLTICFDGAELDTADWTDLPVDCNDGCQDAICDELEVHGRCQNLDRGTDCSVAGGNVCNDDGECVECNEATDCGDPAEPSCESRSCQSESCVVTYQPAGTALPSGQQQEGDCHELRCDGAGTVVDAVDDGDVYDDNNDCTDDRCSSGAVINDPLPLNAACGINDDLFCDGLGTCVGCTDVAQCGPEPTYPECMEWTCPSSTQQCTAVYHPDVVLSIQALGDCRRLVCNDSGGVNNEVYDTDLPVDGNDCTRDVCTNGSPSNPPVKGGEPCSSGVCNGLESCEECYSAAQCPLPAQVCMEDYCDATWACQERPVADGDAALPEHQVPGDCHTIRCDGTGSPYSPDEINDSDTPDDGNDCTTGTCSDGTPSNVPRADGATCSGGASGECWDGFCCDVVCDRTCEACSEALTGQSDGQCAPIPAGTDPEGDCPADQLCNAPGDCDFVDGRSCGSGGDCLSDHCVDGFCCVSSCLATCYSCGLAGSEGTCTMVPAGQDPDPDCAAGQVCDGSGSCLMDDGASCGGDGDCLSGHCVDGFCCNSACGATCYSCGLTGSEGTCTAVPSGQDPDPDCGGGEVCDGGGLCLKEDGETCGDGNECLSGVCVDSVCCDGSCGGNCEACINLLTGQPDGQCAPIPGGSDPEDECTDGVCDGSGGCLWEDGHACSSADECASGHCPGDDGVCCDTACDGTCESCLAVNTSGTDGACGSVDAYLDPDGECGAGQRCDGGGSCLLDDGEGCGNGTQCISGHCPGDDGVCCDTACDGLCESCIGAETSGSDGECGAVDPGTDPEGECAPLSCVDQGMCCGDDVAPPGGTCPGMCDDCNGNVCTIYADQNKEYDKSTIDCPAGFACRIECSGNQACKETTINCPADHPCGLVCSCSGSDVQCCQTAVLNCSTGTCDLVCGGGTQPCDGATVNCGVNQCTQSCVNPSTSTQVCGSSCDCTSTGC